MNPDENPIYNLQPKDTNITREDVMAIVNEMLSMQTGANKMASGYFQSQNFVSGVSGWQLSDNSAEFNVGVNVSSINIPDITTANSFHVDSSGNSWWGSNVATGYTGANAYVLNNGGAVFKNVQIGGTTIQYVITNSGIFSFGDGSDGNATISVNTTLTGDKYYNNLTVNSGVTLNPGGYRIFVKDTLTLNGTITGDGGGADGYLKGSLTVGSGGAHGTSGGVATVGGNGTNAANSLGTSASSSQRGGDGAVTSGSGGAGDGRNGGTAGVATVSNVKLIANWHLATLLDISSSGSTVKFNNSASAPGGGGGGGDGSGNNWMNGGDGGDGGKSGRIIAVYARNIVISATGLITSNGENGHDGGTPSIIGHPFPGPTWAGYGGAGAGGNGGIVILVYNNISNLGSITVNAGVGGIGGGQMYDSGVVKTANTQTNSGSVGTIYQFQLSL